MGLGPLEGASPFDLKRKGDFARALTAYAREFSSALEREDGFIAEISFEQMFDVCLLEHLQKGSRFETRTELLESIKERLAETLRLESTDNYFHNRFDSCKTKLFPQGRGTNPFSVDPKWLLEHSTIA